MNVDLMRNNAHSKYFLHVLERGAPVDMWSFHDSHNVYTYCNPDQPSFSCIDHFALSADLAVLCKPSNVCHEATNPSRHSPIVIEVSISSRVRVSYEGTRGKLSVGPRINWLTAAPYTEAYQDELYGLLSHLPFDADAIGCGDVACKNRRHIDAIDALCQALIECVLSADHVFPRKRRLRRVLCGWNEHCKDYRDECIFWFNSWKLSGQRDGYLFDMMKTSRREFYYAVRRLKRRQRELRNRKFCEALAENRTRDFFSEVKKMNPKPGPPPVIDGMHDKEDIANHMSTKYKQLYNSVPSDADQLRRISQTIESEMNKVPKDAFFISLGDVEGALKKLKPMKGDGDAGFSSSHLLYSSMLYRSQVAALFTAMTVHGHQPSALLNASIISIPKDFCKSLSDSSNYRGIALCCSIAKLLDLIFLERNRGSLQTDDLQYTFKEKTGTSMCTLALKEIVYYYLNRKSDVYACFLDCTKAFDRVRFDLLFENLMDRGVHAADLRLLMDLYSRQRIRTLWKNKHSAYFGTQNGIRQGSIASPVLFCIYLDNLIKKLRRKGVGCWVGGSFFGALAYADDVALLCPSIGGLQEMVEMCEEFAAEWDLTFNSQKSMCLHFSRKKEEERRPVRLNGIELKWTSTFKYIPGQPCLTRSGGERRCREKARRPLREDQRCAGAGPQSEQGDHL